MTMNAYTKDPEETLDYEIDWAKWLGTDRILDSVWTVPDGITKSLDTVQDGVATVVWLLGGTLGRNYTLTNRITTVAGRISERSISIRIRSK